MILPPLKTDIYGVGKPSDHSAPYAQPYTDTSKPRKKEYSYKLTRPIPDSGKRDFMAWISNEEFADMKVCDDPTEKVKAFENTINENIKRILPSKQIKQFQGDK